MPLNRCEIDGGPGWKWGQSGTCYPFTAGSEESETAARKKALAQAAAMGEFPGTGQNRSRSAGEVYIRNSTLKDVDKRQRLIDMVAVPWDQEAEVLWRGQVWKESFDPHAFDGIEDHAGRVRVNRQHVYGDTVGKVVQFDPSHKYGLLARAKIAETPRGDETLALAEEDMISPSVGYTIQRSGDMRLNNRNMTRRINRAFMDHLALVEDPQVPGAGVLAVRSESSGLAIAEQRSLPQTPALDEFLNDPLFAWVAQRFDSR